MYDIIIYVLLTKENLFMKRTFWSKYGRIILFAGALLAGIVIVRHAFGDTLPELWRLLKAGDEKEIELYLSSHNKWKGYAAVFILSVLQVISIVFPGFAIQISAGVIYGFWRAFILTYTGFIAGNMLVFLSAKRIGPGAQGAPGGRSRDNKAARWLYEKMKTTKPGFVVSFVNLLPILPNGIIPYIAAGSNSISAPHYLLAISISSWIQIMFNCLAGHFLMRGQYLFMVLSIGIQVALLAVATFKRKWIMNLLPGPTIEETHGRKETGEEG